jgi:hypothetical protein
MSRTHFTCLQRLHHHQWACTVTYRWEIRGDTTLTSSSESHVFAKADTWTFSSDHLHLSCGSFRVILHILTPNDFRAEKRFRLS